MRSFPVAFPAFSFFPEHVCFGIICHKPAVGDQCRMASYADFMNNFLTCFPDKDYLRFSSQGEDRGMPHTIFCLEEIFAENIIMRYMTIVAGCFFPVRAVRPCCVLRGHYMTVDAG